MKKLLQGPKRFWLLMLIALVVFGGMFQAGSTHSWFLFSDSADVSLQSGQVSYLPTDNSDKAFGGFIPDTKEEEENSYIYPGRQLIALKEDGTTLNILKLENHSTITTNVRVRVTGTVVMNYGEANALTKSAICWEGPDKGNCFLGLTNAVGDVEMKIPLLQLNFGAASGAEGYSWKLAGTPVKQGTFEWELMAEDQIVSTAEVKVPAVEQSDPYDVLTSVQVIPELTSAEEERIFTEIYSGSRLLLKVEYLAKQHDQVEWTVFYENSLAL